MSEVLVQYDLIEEKFVTKNDSPSSMEIEVCTKFNSILADVRGWLNLQRSTGKYARGFVIQLVTNHFDPNFHPFSIYDEIGKLEGTNQTPSLTKQPKPMKFPLKGLWHKHYFHAGFLVRNLKDEMAKMEKVGREQSIFAPYFGKSSEEFLPQIAHEMTIGAFEKLAKDRRITGEFIVYDRLDDGSNYYLTLGKHGEWDAIRARVEEHRKFDKTKRCLV